MIFVKSFHAAKVPVFASVKISSQFPIGSFPTFDLGEISLGFLSQLLTYFLIAAVEGGQFSTLEKLCGQFRIRYLFTKLKQKVKTVKI